MTGQQLGHYKIFEKLGEGGMGIVYKARDGHLDRVVALKILPKGYIADAERRTRFIQEAKAASALNHPNIVTIHDVDRVDGHDYIAMEYIAGKTLDALIGKTGLRLNQALAYAVQIAESVAAAHAGRIIHRDLKPSNVMVTESGAVKVLDFGLAKQIEPAPAGPDAATLTNRAPLTQDGAIVGTVAYMSPEQAEGKKLDTRSDIFSFGTVLYEMLTGQRPFRGESKVSTMAAILREEPKLVTALAPALPRELERIVSRCLRKNPARRFQHMADVKVALDELRDELESGRLSAPAAVAVAAPLAVDRIRGLRIHRGGHRDLVCEPPLAAAAGILLPAIDLRLRPHHYARDLARGPTGCLRHRPRFGLEPRPVCPAGVRRQPGSIDRSRRGRLRSRVFSGRNPDRVRIQARRRRSLHGVRAGGRRAAGGQARDAAAILP